MLLDRAFKLSWTTIMMLVPERKLTKLVKLMRHYNVFPIFLPTYRGPGPDGKHPICPVLWSIVQEVIEHLLAATDQEMLAIHQDLASFWRSQVGEDLLLARDSEAIERLALYHVITLVGQRYIDFRAHLRGDYLERSIVLETYPELTSYHDDEGLLLLDVPGLSPTESGVFYRDHMLHYHQFLRRGFTSNPNFDFLYTLTAYHQEHPDQRVAVAIDHTRLMPKEWFSRVMEFDRWFGPPLDWESVDDPNEVGLTVHTRSADSIHNFIDPLDRTEFFWPYRSGVKTLQVEEMHSIEVASEVRADVVINRYIHSQRDTSSQAFVHLDGAVKVYQVSSYKNRYQEKIPGEVKSDYKVKLFRIDGAIEDDEWARLVSFFFRGNEMVLEYLNSDYEAEG